VANAHVLRGQGGSVAGAGARGWAGVACLMRMVQVVHMPTCMTNSSTFSPWLRKPPHYQPH
jgi:hypothetical protein